MKKFQPADGRAVFDDLVLSGNTDSTIFTFDIIRPYISIMQIEPKTWSSSQFECISRDGDLITTQDSTTEFQNIDCMWVHWRSRKRVDAKLK